MTDYSAMDKSELIAQLTRRDHVVECLNAVIDEQNETIAETKEMADRLGPMMDEMSEDHYKELVRYEDQHRKLEKKLIKYDVDNKALQSQVKELKADTKKLSEAALLGQEVQRLKDVAKCSVVYSHWLNERLDAQRREEDAEKRAELVTANEYLLEENERCLEEIFRLT